MLHVTPFVEDAAEEAAPRWPALVGSAGIHLLLILFVLWRTQAEEPTPAALPDFPEEQQELALDPLPPFEVPREAERQPPPPDEPRTLGPDSDRPDAPVPVEQGETPPAPEDTPITAADPVRTPPPDDDRTPPPPADRVARADESGQTGRLQTPTSPFGPRPPIVPRGSGGIASAPEIRSAGAMGRAGASNLDTRVWRPSAPEAAGSCVEIPDFGTNPDGTPVLASVMGIVKDDRGFPLPNAHLQLVGHTFSTFTDRLGRYRLEFDPKLLQRCRVQYIRVSADGYNGANLVLQVGRRVVSDDVVLRRK